MYIKHLILFLALCTFSLHNNIIPVRLSENGGYVYISFSLVNLTKYSKFFPDLENSITFFDQLFLSISSSAQDVPPFPELKTISVFNKNFPCNLKKSSLRLSNVAIIDDFYFCYGQNYNKVAPHLALGYKIEHKEFSIIYKAYSQNIINDLSFSIISTKKHEAYLYLGGVPDNYISVPHGHCDVTENYNGWNCMITKVSFFDFSYVKSEPILFSMSWFSVLKTSNSFYNYFNKKCLKVQTEKYKTQKYELNIKIGNCVITIDDAIKKEDNGFFILTVFYGHEDEWVLYYPFMSKYLIHFDYNKKRITLYGNDIVINKEFALITRVIMIIFNSISLTLVSIVLVVIRLKSNNA